MSKPVLVVIDDDAAVSRDLRRRYVRDYRVLRTDSGPEALAALRELALRGDRPAVLLADHRMPDMSGVEFLEQAMDAFPEAKRVLLTAYADTEAAIQAINTVDLDRYLLKPWDPPEEHLYPVLDDLLDDWAAAQRPTFDGVAHRGTSLVDAVPPGQGLSGAQRGALRVAGRRRRGRAAPAVRRTGRRQRAARRGHPRRERAAPANHPRAGRAHRPFGHR